MLVGRMRGTEMILFNFEGLSEELRTLKVIYGGVAQLGEHLLCKQGVVSSSLIISTRALGSLEG